MSKNNTLLFWVVIILVVIFLLPYFLVVSPTHSLNYRVFVKKFGITPDKIKKGDYVVFTISSKHVFDGKPTRIIKEVTCVDGEFVYKTPTNIYYCNNDINQFLGVAKSHSLKGVSVNSYGVIGSNNIGKGYIFVSGADVDSYDSKYFGPMRRQDVKEILYPIF